MSIHPVLIDGAWRASSGTQSFQAVNPATREPLPDRYPVSPWNEIEQAVAAARRAFLAAADALPERFARFLERYAGSIEQHKNQLVAQAQLETALPAEPRLASVELPRTVNQLRQAAAAARNGSWQTPIIDTAANIRSLRAPLGPVVVFGPNNFPFAFNGISGGDFAAAVAAGNPVIAKAHSSHPGTSRLFAELAHQAAVAEELPAGFVQMIYRSSHADGQRLVAHPDIGATGYTGARDTGLVLKQAADQAGKPIYLELSSINPVCLLPGALHERAGQIADEFTTSCLAGTGQFCTNPGLVVMLAGPGAEAFIELARQKFEAARPGTLLGAGVLEHLARGVAALLDAGAQLVTGGQPADNPGFCFRNTLLRVAGGRFLAQPRALQTEAFGNASLFVLAANAGELQQVLEALEGNLTGTIYSAMDGRDDALYNQIAPIMRRRVGRLLNDKMPTGVAVSPAMNHGGPYPATGHPGFTAVGIPTAIARFTALHCYDNVRPHRLPAALANKNPTGQLWRFIDGAWSQADVQP